MYNEDIQTIELHIKSTILKYLFGPFFKILDDLQGLH